MWYHYVISHSDMIYHYLFHYVFHTGNGPDHWADAFATCSGNFQSPINFVLNAADIDDDLGEITFTGYSNPSLSTGMVLSNNGHTGN